MSQWMDGAAVAYRNTAAIRHLRNQSTTLDSYPGVTQAEKEGGGLTYHHGEFTKLSTATAASRTSAGRPGPCTSRINADDAEAAADCDADDGEDDVDGVSGLKNRRKKNRKFGQIVLSSTVGIFDGTPDRGLTVLQWILDTKLSNDVNSVNDVDCFV